MTRTARKRKRLILPALAAGLGATAIFAQPNLGGTGAFAQDAPVQTPAPEASQEPATPDAATDAVTPDKTSPDPAAELARKRDETRTELEALSKTINLSSDKVMALQKSIADLDKSSTNIRQALIDSAARRKTLEKQILESEKKLADLGVKEDAIRRSLHERRGLLAEVLAALQRMGRNPPPALLVTPDDALASVRSAILLGAVVPGMRKETDKLAADLANLAGAAGSQRHGKGRSYRHDDEQHRGRAAHGHAARRKRQAEPQQYCGS